MVEHIPSVKPWWRSKTVWFNIGTGLLAVAAEFAAVVDVLPDEWQAQARLGISLLIMAGNVILRFATHEPVR